MALRIVQKRSKNFSQSGWLRRETQCRGRTDRVEAYWKKVSPARGHICQFGPVIGNSQMYLQLFSSCVGSFYKRIAHPLTKADDAEVAFGHSIQYPMFVDICKKALPGSKAELESGLKKWASRPIKIRLRVGEKMIRQEGLRTHTDTVAMLNTPIIWVVDDFEKEPKDEKVKHCGEFLGHTEEREPI